MQQKLSFFLPLLLSLFFLGVVYVFAWSPPPSSPPAGNVAAPLNVNSTAQIKAGGLILNTGGATNGLIVDQGKVGIGTTAPDAKLHVIGSICAEGSDTGCAPSSGYVRGVGLCIGTDCRTSWPSSGSPSSASYLVLGLDGTLSNERVLTAGNGISFVDTGVNGTLTISANTSVVQTRVTGTCAAGSSIRIINANGTVTCETDDAGASGGPVAMQGANCHVFGKTPCTLFAQCPAGMTVKSAGRSVSVGVQGNSRTIEYGVAAFNAIGSISPSMCSGSTSCTYSYGGDSDNNESWGVMLILCQ